MLPEVPTPAPARPDTGKTPRKPNTEAPRPTQTPRPKLSLWGRS